MTNLSDIQAQIIELQKQEKLMLAQEYKSTLDKVQDLIKSFKIPASDLVFYAEGNPSAKKVRAASSGSGKKAEIKYRDENGNGWSGRGLKPKWLTAALATGKTIEEFAVTQSTLAA